MKKLMIILLAFPPLVFCDTKISNLTPTTSMAQTDIIPIVINPGTTPDNRIITLQNLSGSIVSTITANSLGALPANFGIVGATVAIPVVIQPSVNDTAQQAFGIFASTNEAYSLVVGTTGVANTSALLVSTSGWAGFQNGSVANPSVQFYKQGAVGFFSPTTASIGLSIGGTERARFASGSSGGVLSVLDNASANTSINTIGWGPTVGTNDTALLRDSAQVIGFRQGVTPVQINTYNTYTSSNSYERAQIGWKNTGNTFTINTASGPVAGSLRNIAFCTTGCNVGISTGSPQAVLEVNGYSLFDSSITTGNIFFSPTTAGIGGTTTNNNATSGNVGEYISANIGVTNAPTTSQWGDLTSISLTAGDWDVTLGMLGATNGASVTRAVIGVGKTTGNNAPDISGVAGDDSIDLATPYSGGNPAGALSAVRVSIATTTTIYFKMFAIYTGGPMQFRGRISARRVR